MIRVPSRNDPPVRAVLERWRALTGAGPDRNANRRTLVACSGGADSSALSLILRSASEDLVLGHVVHDLRPRADALADRDAAGRLAQALGLEFVSAEIESKNSGKNIESAARDARYAALAHLAERCHCPYIATAHHADDQLETMLMRLLRGAGPVGLAGIAPSRVLAGVTLIRPMLAIDRAGAEGLCERAGWAWQVDKTNDDLSRTRAFLRARVLPALLELQPRAGERAVVAGALLGEAGEMIAARAKGLIPVIENGKIRLARDSIRQEPGVILGEVIRQCARELTGGRGMDRLGAEAIFRIVAAIREQSGEPKRFTLARVEIRIDPAWIVLYTTPGQK